MNYFKLMKENEGKKTKVGIIGATRGYGYTLLAQIPKIPLMELRVISSRHVNECMEVLTGIGYSKDNIKICDTIEDIKCAPEDSVLIVKDYRLVTECGINSLVECTGNTAVSCDISVSALKKKINVYMVSKETDSVCGPILNRIASENGVIYALVNGDQPRNLLDLYSWGKLLGLDIICAGKASEYDFVWDPETGFFSYMETNNEQQEYLPTMMDFWHYKDTTTLENRKELLKSYMSVISADLCEMNLVSNVTGFVPSAPRLNYPIAKISELADIFIPEADGGILKNTGVVDVFCNLRAPDEASFAGGEFIIVRCENDAVWKLLKEKGHLVSRNGKYACLYLPYHFMGVETPTSILLGDFMGIGTHEECRQVAVMVGVADRDLPAGTTLTVQGHHHSIDGLIPELLEADVSRDLVPFYLLNGVALLNDIKAGNPIRFSDLNLEHSIPLEMYKKGLEL